MSHRFRVAVTDLILEPLNYEREILDGVADVVALDAKSEDDLIGQIENVDALMVYHYLTLTNSTIDKLQQCKVIVRPGVGYDGIDIEAAKARQIPVCNVPDYGTEEVADTAMAMVLALARGSHFLNSRVRRGLGQWNVAQAGSIPRLRERIFGVIGCGRIGTATVLRARAFGMNVVFYDPYVPDGIDKALGIRRCDTLEELLEASHIISLHCPLTTETRGMIGAAEIQAMQPGGILVNTARGGIVDTEAVVEALASEHLSGAGIDVLEVEPPASDSKVLRAWRDENHIAHDRLILNPHTAYYCDEGEAEFRTKGAREVLRALRNEPLRNVVNGVRT